MDKRTVMAGLVAALALACSDAAGELAGSMMRAADEPMTAAGSGMSAGTGGLGSSTGVAGQMLADAPDAGNVESPPSMHDAATETPPAGMSGAGTGAGGVGGGAGSAAGGAGMAAGAAGTAGDAAGSSGAGASGSGGTGGIASWEDPTIIGGGCDLGFESESYRVTLTTVVINTPTTYKTDVLYAEINANGFPLEQLARSRLWRCEKQDVTAILEPLVCPDRTVLCEADDCLEYELVDKRLTGDGWVQIVCSETHYATNTGERSGERWNTVQLVIPP